MNLVEQTEAFLKKTFQESTYLREHEADGNYRFEHSYRVANIAGEIARQEGLDVEGLIIAGLLHDISYCEEFEKEEDWMNHGRKSAKMAREFLEELGMEKDRIQDICYGIAIHVDDQADFDGERNAFTISVGDADNIDRFDAYRIYEGLQYDKFSSKTLQEKREKVDTRLNQLESLMQMEMGTDTAKKLWNARLQFQKEYFTKIQAQLENSTKIK